MLTRQNVAMQLFVYRRGLKEKQKNIFIGINKILFPDFQAFLKAFHVLKKEII
jgi:hypothetical protein